LEKLQMVKFSEKWVAVTASSVWSCAYVLCLKITSIQYLLTSNKIFILKPGPFMTLCLRIVAQKF
jgi:hypothetical protein